MSRNEMVELELLWVAETTMSWGVTEDEPDDPVIWLPKSQCEMGKHTELGQTATFEVPEWLAIEKGLV